MVEIAVNWTGKSKAINIFDFVIFFGKKYIFSNCFYGSFIVDAYTRFIKYSGTMA